MSHSKITMAADDSREAALHALAPFSDCFKCMVKTPRAGRDGKDLTSAFKCFHPKVIPVISAHL